MSTAALPQQPSSSPWAPFRYRVFAVIWTASLLSNIGTWMRDVGAGWLMTSLSASALHVALVQAATTLPVFVLSLPAGALADIVNRRVFILAANALLAVIALLLALATTYELVTPTLLIAAIFVGGMCTALLQPMQQSLNPLMAPREHLQSSIALNSMGINVARAIGPAIAGVLIGVWGVASAFYLDALSYLGVILAFLWWRAASQKASTDAPERMLPAMRAGVRYAWNSDAFRRILLRASAFFMFASAYWALLPLLARNELGGDARYYGLLLACVGAGAVAGAVLLPKLRKRTTADGVLQLGTAVTVVVLLVQSFSTSKAAVAAAMAFAGAGWIAAMTTANVGAQTALPNWVRGRGLSIYLMVFSGSMTAGSLLWGSLASLVGVRPALAAAAALGVLTLLIARLKPLSQAPADLTPSGHWAAPVVSADVLSSDSGERGPVMVTVEYQVSQSGRGGFLHALQGLRKERLRDGAYEWGVFEDVASPGRFVECFYLASWEEHLRQHHRVSKADADLQEQVLTFHIGASPPLVQHFVAPGSSGLPPPRHE